MRWRPISKAPRDGPQLAGRRRQGLSRLSPDQIGKAINETEKQINTIMLAFIGVTAFCVLSLLSPDSALLGGSDKVNVPLAGPVSFVGFIIIGPALLVVLRVYLEIYIEHGKRLTRVARLVSAKRDPTLLSSQNGFLRIAFAVVLFLLLPLTLLMFAWKAAVFPVWGAVLLCVAAAVIAGHAMLPLRGFSRRSKVLLSVSVAIFAGGAMLGFGMPRRPFDLFHANLSGQWLAFDDLRDADLRFANLSSAYLTVAHLEHADLFGAHLEHADLFGAHLEGSSLNEAHLEGVDLAQAHLEHANLSVAHLEGAYLGSAHLDGANLSSAHLDNTNLTFAHLENADLTVAHLEHANLGFANLREADLADASLLEAYLDGTYLSKARGLTQAQIDQANGGTKTKLPDGLTRPARWTAPAGDAAPIKP